MAWEFSITKLQNGSYYMMAPAAGELLIKDWLAQRLATDSSVELTNILRQ
ncbi:hypothetical protein [Pontibacterium sp.]